MTLTEKQKLEIIYLVMPEFIENNADEFPSIYNELLNADQTSGGEIPEGVETVTQYQGHSARGLLTKIQDFAACVEHAYIPEILKIVGVKHAELLKECHSVIDELTEVLPPSELGRKVFLRGRRCSDNLAAVLGMLPATPTKRVSFSIFSRDGDGCTLYWNKNLGWGDYLYASTFDSLEDIVYPEGWIGVYANGLHIEGKCPR